MILIYLLIICILQGCIVSAGVAYHPKSLDFPEINLSSDLGVVRGEHQFNKITGFCEHVSGLDDRESGAGLNMCGAMVRIK